MSYISKWISEEIEYAKKKSKIIYLMELLSHIPSSILSLKKQKQQLKMQLRSIRKAENQMKYKAEIKHKKVTILKKQAMKSKSQDG